MRKTILTSICMLFVFPFFGQKRYINQIFPSIDTLMNLPYGVSKNLKGEDQVLTLSLFSPKNDTLSKRPVVVFIHGGGFVNGDKNSGYAKTVSVDLAKRGFVVASINYRLGVESPRSDTTYFEAMIRAVQDAKAAIRFMRKNAVEFGLDTASICISGGSAGGMTALHLAYLGENEVPPQIKKSSYGSLEGNSGNEGYSSKVHAVVNFWGSMANINWIQQNDIPVFSVHGTTDRTVPFDSSFSYHGFKYGSAIIYEHALKKGIPTGIKLVAGLGHTLDNNQAALKSSLDEVALWLYLMMDQSKSNTNRLSKEIGAFKRVHKSGKYAEHAVLFSDNSRISYKQSSKESRTH